MTDRYLAALPDERLLERCAEAIRYAGPHCVISSVTAAQLHCLWLPASLSGETAIHVATVTPDRAGRAMIRSRRSGHIAHRFQLTPEDVTMVCGLPTTTLARTWRDLGRSMVLPDLVAAGDSALRAGASAEERAAALNGWPTSPVRSTSKLALSMLDKRSRSLPESHLRVAVHGLSTIAFEVNEPVSRREGGWLAEPDLSLEQALLALEYQGSDHAAVDRMRRDLTRARDMRQDGWAVLAYGPAEVLGRPWQVRAEVRANLQTRAPGLVIREIRRRPFAQTWK